jgi:hypothetical protein
VVQGRVGGDTATSRRRDVWAACGQAQGRRMGVWAAARRRPAKGFKLSDRGRGRFRAKSLNFRGLD